MKAPGNHSIFARFSNLLEIQKKPLQLLERNFSHFGSIVSIPIGPINTILLADPESIGYVLKSANFVKQTRPYMAFRDAIGDGLVSAEGVVWTRHRKALSGGFKKVDKHLLVNATGAYLDALNLHSGTSHVNLTKLLKSIVMKLAFLTFFGVEASGSDIQTAMDAVTGYQIEISNRIRRWRPGVIKRDRHILDLDRLISARLHVLSTANGDQSIIGQLFLHSERVLNFNEILAESRTLLLAGFDTTANTLNWIFYCLFRHPEILEKIQKDIHDLSHNSELLIKEVLRLYPPVPVLTRKAIQADTISGYAINPKDQITVCPYLLHRNPQYWHSPLTFDLTRFQTLPIPGAFMPFSSGPRQCIGRDLAISEMSIIVNEILSRFFIRPTTIPALEYAPNAITLALREPLRANLTHR